MIESTELAGGDVLVDRDDRVAYVTLNRPQAHNSFTSVMYHDLTGWLNRAAGDRTLRVIVFRGAGEKAFAAGTDISEFTNFTSGDDGVEYEKIAASTLTALQRAPQVTIAAVQGVAVGSGCAVALSCDVRVATERSKFGFPIASTLGNALSSTVLRRLVATVGPAVAREMLLTSRLVSATRAHQLGFVAEVLLASTFHDTVSELATRTALLAPHTQAVSKAIIDSIEQGREVDDESLVRGAYAHADFRDAVTAFVAKDKGFAFSELLADLP